ncbi:MAG TPA: acyl carrier protein [bacterium]
MDRSTGPNADIAAQVAQILVRHSDAGLEPEQVTTDVALIDTGLDLSSVDLLEALVEIETALKVRLTDESLTVEALSSFGTFVEHVCRRIGSNAPGSGSAHG